MGEAILAASLSLPSSSNRLIGSATALQPSIRLLNRSALVLKAGGLTMAVVTGTAKALLKKKASVSKAIKRRKIDKLIIMFPCSSSFL